MRRFEMDHSTRFSFFAFLTIYLRVAGWVMVGSTILALVAAQLHLPDAAVWLAAAAVTALLFNVRITWCYEMYLHSKYPLNVPPIVVKKQPWPEGVEFPVGVTGGPVQDTSTVRDRPGYEAQYVGPSNYTTIHYAITNLLAIVTLSTFAWGLVTMILGISER